MWIRREIENQLATTIHKLQEQVLLVRGARQVGKTATVEKILEQAKDSHVIRVNLLHPHSIEIKSKTYFGRDFFGTSEDGHELIKNIRHVAGNGHAIVFVDECDRYPIVMESIQNLAQFSQTIKFVFTGSNLENLAPKNAATGRKKYIDIYPVDFQEYLEAAGHKDLSEILRQMTVGNLSNITGFLHEQFTDHHRRFIRLGGMPKILTTFFAGGTESNIATAIQDLAISIEENVKSILGDRFAVYQYHDFLRSLCRHSLNTLKLTHIQANHLARNEAKKLVAKTVGARVTHKIRLFDHDTDLSKYVLFDSGIAHYLLAGSNVLSNRLHESELAILNETAVCNALITSLNSRDDLMYWKSNNKAEVEFTLRSPRFVGIDVKSTTGALRSLCSMAAQEKDLDGIVKVSQDPPKLYRKYEAKSFDAQRVLPLLMIPHYMTRSLTQLLNEL
jgi:predicted AAA+ superfamily ATPase